MNPYRKNYGSCRYTSGKKLYDQYMKNNLWIKFVTQKFKRKRLNSDYHKTHSRQKKILAYEHIDRILIQNLMRRAKDIIFREKCGRGNFNTMGRDMQTF